jgi:sporulation protein YlmC with PRC-barrel domain
LSKSQNEGNVSKSKLIGKSVVDQEGNLVGTVKDVGFAGGKQGISLVVENKNGESQDIAWDTIQGAADFVILKPAQQSASSPQMQAQPVQQYAQPVQTVQSQVTQPVQQTQSATPLCPICHTPLTWIPQYKRWYCYKDQKYA